MKSGRNNRQVEAVVMTNPLVLISIGLLVLLMLLAGAVLSDAEISGDARDLSSSAVPEPRENEDSESTRDDGKTVDTVTMEIPIQKGGTVDLKLHSKDVTISRYDGDNVLLIIESSKPAGPHRHGSKGSGPMDIQITRKGHDVQIESVGRNGSVQPPVDVSFTIMVPSQGQVFSENQTHGKVVSKLLSAVQRTLTRETLKWLM
jgi:hypothetical protein